MVEMSRRLSSTQYVLIGILFGTCVYLWTRKLTDGHGIPSKRYRVQQEEEVVSDLENTIDDWTEKKVNNAEMDVEPDANLLSGMDEPQQQKKIADVDRDAEPIDDPLRTAQVLEEPRKSPELKEVELSNSGPSEDTEPLIDQSTDATETEQEAMPEPATSSDHSSPSGIKPFPPMTSATRRAGANQTLNSLDLWNYDANCTKFEVKLLDNHSLEKRALVSFPGSGNSWLRMLLMGLSGVFIHSVYPGDDARMISKANSSYEVPTDCGCTLLQKTHDFSLDAALYFLPETNRTHVLQEFNGRGVLILRNPFSAIPSYRNFDSGGMQGKAPSTAFEGVEWDNFIGRSIAAWETLAIVWIRGLIQGGIIYYEKLQHEMPHELARVASMLGLPHDQERLDCVLRHANDNSFKRTKSANQTESLYNASQRMLIHKAIENVQAVLKERGLDPLPTQYYDYFSVLPEYGIQRAFS